MKQESINKLKTKIIDTYKAYGDKIILVAPESITSSAMRYYSGNQIAEAIEKETELGIKHIDLLIQLTIDLLVRQKIKQ